MISERKLFKEGTYPYTRYIDDLYREIFGTTESEELRIVKDNENLICVDLICHGVPATELFEKYILELETSYADKVVGVDERIYNHVCDTIDNKFKSRKDKIKVCSIINFRSDNYERWI